MKQPTKTDNKSVANKVFLRKKATEHLDKLYVLDLFAGNNVLWSGIDKARYYGVELMAGKGKNLNADARQAVASLDLSGFNVIDCDCYGIPYEVCKKILENNSAKSGTVVIFTAITNALSGLTKMCMDDQNIGQMYKTAPTTFNQNGVEYFYDMLGNLGITKIKYYEANDSYIKHYGYFVIE
ncbi:MAG: hypothetical protein FWB74_01285 [Defluviitaleaceae bacterium]|nr:hypothetical protein [Defluviitaleaceae bacterium]